MSSHLALLDDEGGFLGLLSGGNPLFNAGLGILAAGGPSAQPQNFGQRLARGLQLGQGFGGGFLENRLARARLLKLASEREAEQRRLTAAGRLGEIDPRLGLLAELNPEAAGRALGGLLAPAGEDRGTSLIRNAIASGLTPGTPEFQAFMRSQITQGGTQEQLARTQALLAEIQAEQRTLGLKKEAREEVAASRKDRAERAGTLNGMNLELAQIQEAAGLLDELQGTPLQAGVGFDERATGLGALNLAKDFFSGDTKKATQLVTKANRLTQLRNTLSMGSIQQLRQSLGGRVTQQEFAVLQQGNFDPRNVRDANRVFLADRVRSILGAARAEELDLPNRARFEALAEELRGPGRAVEALPLPRSPGQAVENLRRRAEESGVVPPGAGSPQERRLPEHITRQRLGQLTDRLAVEVENGLAFLKNKLTGRRRPLTAAERREIGILPEHLIEEGIP